MPVEFRRGEPLLEGLEQLMDVVPIVPGQEQGGSASPHSPVHGLVFAGPHDVVLYAAPAPDDPGHLSGRPGFFQFDPLGLLMAEEVKRNERQHAEDSPRSGRHAERPGQQDGQSQDGRQHPQPQQAEGHPGRGVRIRRQSAEHEGGEFLEVLQLGHGFPAGEEHQKGHPRQKRPEEKGGHARRRFPSI